MNRLFFGTVMLLFVLNTKMVCAYERPLVQEGKQWNFILTKVDYYANHEDSCTITQENYTLILQGDTLIDGYTCIKLYEWFRDSGIKKYLCAMREDSNHVVYMINEGTVYQFTTPYGSPFSNYSNMYDVFTDTIDISSEQLFQRYHFVQKLTGYDDPLRRWIDGVGSMGGPLRADGKNAIPRCYCYYELYEFVSCELPGEWIVVAEDFYKNPVVNSIKTHEERSSSESIYDMTGKAIRKNKKKSVKSLRPGIYIRNGKKVAIK